MDCKDVGRVNVELVTVFNPSRLVYFNKLYENEN